jgi:uncharacterized membrane protein YhaH (DUF805 family)
MMDWSYLFLRFDGRISRKPYWIASCVLIAGGVISWLIADYYGGERLTAVPDFALMYPEFAVVIKRAHDRETPFWILILYFFLGVLANTITILGLDGPIDNTSTLYLIVLVPWLAVSFYLIFDLGFRRGIRGPNRFGPDPLERQS